MSPYRPAKTAVSRLSLLSACTLVVAMLACETPGERTVSQSQALVGDSGAGAQPPRPTPPPPFANIDSASSLAVLRYAATLEFVDELARTDTATIVREGDSALVRISPEIGTRSLTSAQLQQGRITARWMHFGDSVRYPMRTMLGYIWTDSGTTGWRMIYFPADTAYPRVVGGALVVEDTKLADAFPQTYSNMMRSGPGGGGIVPYGCYYTNRRWICPMFVGLTQEEVTRAYNTR